MAHVDTSVIIAKCVPEDKLHSKAFLELDRKRKIASPVSVVELAVVISRLERDLHVARDPIGAAEKTLTCNSRIHHQRLQHNGRIRPGAS